MKRITVTFFEADVNKATFQCLDQLYIVYYFNNYSVIPI